MTDPIAVVTEDDKQRYRQTYENWLATGGASYQTIANDKVFSELIYTHSNKMTVNVIQMKDATDRIILTARLALDAGAKQALFSLPEDVQVGLANELTLLLIQLGVQFNFILQDQKLLLAIAIEKTLFGESLGKQAFYDNLFRIIDVTVAIQTKFREKLGIMAAGKGGARAEAADSGTSFYA